MSIYTNVASYYHQVASWHIYMFALSQCCHVVVQVHTPARWLGHTCPRIHIPALSQSHHVAVQDIPVHVPATSKFWHMVASVCLFTCLARPSAITWQPGYVCLHTCSVQDCQLLVWAHRFTWLIVPGPLSLGMALSQSQGFRHDSSHAYHAPVPTCGSPGTSINVHAVFQHHPMVARAIVVTCMPHASTATHWSGYACYMLTVW